MTIDEYIAECEGPYHDGTLAMEERYEEWLNGDPEEIRIRQEGNKAMAEYIIEMIENEMEAD